jgi:cell division inhibitor SepF
MKLLEKVWGSLGLFEQVETELEPQAQTKPEEVPEAKNRKSSNLVNLPTAAAQKQIKVMVVEPFTFDDAQHVADHLKNRKPVVVNFENTDKDVAKRMIDFISGTTYALGGSIQKVGNHIFLCAPNNVDISYSSQEDGMDKAFMPWTQK